LRFAAREESFWNVPPPETLLIDTILCRLCKGSLPHRLPHGRDPLDVLHAEGEYGVTVLCPDTWVLGSNGAESAIKSVKGRTQNGSLTLYGH
jgi:hypothetical protein